MVVCRDFGREGASFGSPVSSVEFGVLGPDYERLLVPQAEVEAILKCFSTDWKNMIVTG